MSKHEFGCPVCGGQLTFVAHRLIQYVKPISKITGKINKKVKTIETTWDTDYYYGVECINCNFKYNASGNEVTGNENIQEDICKKLYEKIEEQNNGNATVEMFKNR